MRHIRFLIAIVGMVSSAPMLQAQQPHRADTTMMTAMDSLNRRLDSLVDRMNRASGNQKVAAMAAVINELVAQRKAMQAHMRRMMDTRAGRMGMMGDSTPPGGRGPAARDSGR